MASNRKLVVIVGPTGVGKSELALRLADKLDLEIVSADSRQMYRYMDIGTAKPTPEERVRVKHHMIDIVDPDQRYTAGDYGRQAREAIEGIFGRGKIPIVEGGSGLYIRALLDGLFEEGTHSPKVKRKLQEEVKLKGTLSLYRELAELDPQAAAKIHPNDSQRIVRALEVFRSTGHRISDLWEQSPSKEFKIDPVILGLTMDRALLYRRIEERVDRMISKGLVEEVESLLEMGYHRGLNSLQTLGYREILAFLDKEMGLAEAIGLIKRNTRRYAKRQLTWFRRDGRIRWVEKAVGESGFILDFIEGALGEKQKVSKNWWLTKHLFFRIF